MNRITKKAFNPEDLETFFIEYLNEGDLDGLLSLYEEDAVLVINDKNNTVSGHTAITAFYTELLREQAKFESGVRQPEIINGDIALTSAILPDGNVTAEVCRRQTDGSWLLIIDQPAIAKIK